MFWFQTFGGPVLLDEEGQALLGGAAQRRTLGVLSVLAVAGRSGLTRDKIVGILWPESPPRRARHSLTQALYSARKALGCDDLFIGTEDLRLNPDRIRSDIEALETALAAGDDESVARLYRGPFLDGLFLSSIEFERWADQHRARFEDRIVVALERLVGRLEDSGELRTAAERLRQLAQIRPSDSTIAIRLMRALSSAGDRAAALQHAEVHARVLRDEFDLDCDPRISSFAEELRVVFVSAEHATQTVVAVETLVLEQSVATEEYPIVEPVRAAPLPVPLRPIRYEGRQRNQRLVPALVVLALLVLAWLVRPRGQSDAFAPLQQSILVAPFSVVGADASLAYLREGMVELLSARLEDDTSTHAVDAGATIRAWRKAGMSRQISTTHDSVARIAAKLGAERVIVGSVVGNPKRAVLSAALITAGSGAVSGRASVEGPTDSIAVLVDRLASKLLSSQIERDAPLTTRTTSSLPGLRSFLTGASALARGDFAAAAEGYERALQYDSTFALAAMHLASAARHLTDFERERRALELASRTPGALSETDRSQLSALLGRAFPAPDTRTEALSAWEAAASIAPTNAEVLYGFAAQLSQDRGYQLRGEEREQALMALRRSLQLDSDFATAALLLFRLTGEDSTLNGSADTLHAFGSFLRWRRAATRSDTVELSQIADSLESFGPANLRLLAATTQFDGMRPDDGARALAVLGARARNLEQAMDILLAQHSLAVNRGRPSEALTVTRRMQSLSPATRVHLRLRVLDAVFAEGDSAAARAAVRELEHSAAQRGQTSGPTACALAQWHFAHRDSVGVRSALAVLRDSAAQNDRSAADYACRELVVAQLIVLTNSPDARATVARVDSLQLNGPAVGDIATFANLALARLYRELGEPQLALSTLRRQPYVRAAWPRYRATAWREESELALQMGDQASARNAVEHYLRMRSGAEPRIAATLGTFRDSLASWSKRSAGSRTNE